jgi:hypothetical protein
MSSVRDMPSVRHLLEAAVPREPGAALTAVEVRAIGRRRVRRSQVAGAAIAVMAIAVSSVGIVRSLAPSPAPVRPTVTVAPSPHPSFRPLPAPSPTGPDFAGLAGTRWIPDLVGSAVSTRQAYPDEPGNAPRALMTFEPGHILVLDYIEHGRTTTLRGTWVATSDTPAVDARAHGSLFLTLPAASAPDTLVMLLNRLSLVTSYAMYVPDRPPPSIAPLTMSAYENASSVFVADLVKPGVVLPSSYPRRP